MPDLKYLYRALHILINYLFKQAVVIYLIKFTIKSRIYQLYSIILWSS